MTALGVGSAAVDSLASILMATVLGVPYNSGTQILEYFAGESVPARLGMSCAWQSYWAARLMHEQCGLPPRYMRDGRHVAVVYRDATTLTILDPYLLHQTPLRLSLEGDASETVVATSDAFPVRVHADGRPAPSRLRGAFDRRTGAIRLDYTRHSVQRGHTVVYRSFLLRADQVFADAPSPPEVVRTRLLHPEQNNLSVRVVHPSSRRLAEVILPLRDLARTNRPCASHLIAKDNDGSVWFAGAPGFQRELEHVADAVGLLPAEVVEYLLHAANVYLDVAPTDRQLATYSLTSE